MARKLARIEMVSDVKPIENADNIEVASILGWQCVVKKGDVKPGDLVVYFEIDSFLPVEPRYEFLRNSSFKKMEVEDENGLITTVEGFRLKTIKLRGQVSQGLVLPVSSFPELKIEQDGTELDRIYTGIDITDNIGVRLYERPVTASMRGLARGGFPSDIKKTDQERIQNHPEYFEKYKDIEFEVTEKIDGTSVTVFIDPDGELNVCSRNLNLKDGDNVYWSAIKETKLYDFLLAHEAEPIAVQAEIAGEGVQGNPLGIKGRRVLIFDIWDIGELRYLTHHERMLLLAEFFGGDSPKLAHVPFVHESFKPFTEYQTMDGLISSAKGKSLLNPSRNREGLVFKSLDLIDGDTLSFKIIDNSLLLKEKDG